MFLTDGYEVRWFWFSLFEGWADCEYFVKGQKMADLAAQSKFFLIRRGMDFE